MKTLPDLYKRRHWTASGYHAFPLTAKDVGVPNYEKWMEFDALLAEAKVGHFRRIPLLVDRVANADSWVLWGQYAQLLGDAGSNQILSQVLESIPLGRDITLEFYYANVLVFWGHLSVIPTLIDMLDRYSFSEDSMYIGAGLSRLLEKDTGEIARFPTDDSRVAVNEYCQMVKERYDQLCDQLGTDDVTVFRGEVIDIKKICQRMLEDLGGRHRFHEEMRHKFEAMTGINCSSFYQDGKLQRLAVAALIEDFLQGPEPSKYTEGVRYFFGHRIPE